MLPITRGCRPPMRSGRWLAAAAWASLALPLLAPSAFAQVSLSALRSLGPVRPAQTQCPANVTVTGATVSPTNVIGGTLTLNATITLSPAPPLNCPYSYNETSSNPQALSSSTCSVVRNAIGQGTSTVSSCAIARVVDQTQTVTLTWQGVQPGSGAPIGGPVSGPAVTVTPIALSDFSISPTFVHSGQSASGTVRLQGIVGSAMYGTARVNIGHTSPTPVAVSMPGSIQIGCCLFDPGHSKGIFTITAGTITKQTTLDVTVARPGQTAIHKTLLLIP